MNIEVGQCIASDTKKNEGSGRNEWGEVAMAYTKQRINENALQVWSTSDYCWIDVVRYENYGRWSDEQHFDWIENENANVAKSLKGVTSNSCCEDWA